MPADHSARETETGARGTGANPAGTQEQEQEQARGQEQTREQEREPVEDVALEGITVTDPVSAPDAGGSIHCCRKSLIWSIRHNRS
ncbi:hypothetical protein ABZ590_38115, partial [Streptomyces hirsutus]|uniref:hypothetical protein n=1 Tax=Streptomyces hirsutus TaxID=35620 RepID=UPI0033C1F2B2